MPNCLTLKVIAFIDLDILLGWGQVHVKLPQPKTKWIDKQTNKNKQTKKQTNKIQKQKQKTNKRKNCNVFLNFNSDYDETAYIWIKIALSGTEITKLTLTVFFFFFFFFFFLMEWYSSVVLEAKYWEKKLKFVVKMWMGTKLAATLHVECLKKLCLVQSWTLYNINQTSFGLNWYR